MKVTLPTPQDLGYNSSLPIRGFNSNNEYTWEDYNEYIEKNYPIRNWLFNIVPMWFSVNISKNVSEFFYRIRSNIDKKYHLLDLRQPGKEGYKYGWVDSDTQMLYANFNILVNFVEKELKEPLDEMIKFHKEISEKEQESDQWYKAYLEIKELYNYWKIDRAIKEKEEQDSLSAWYEKFKDYKNRNNVECDKLSDEHRKLEVEFEEKETEMLLRLIKVRKFMWT